MAQLLHHPLLLLLPLLLTCTTITAHNHHRQELKSLHFTLYDQQTFNKTIYLIVNGVAGANTSETTTPFGTITASRDPLTTTVDPSSSLVGFVEGATVTSTMDGLWNLMAGKVTLNMKRHKGTFSFLGSLHNVRKSDAPVVGGTGDFLFVQGYVRVTSLGQVGLHLTMKLEFHLFWPPFGSQATPSA